MQDGIACTEHIRGVWEAGVRWKYWLLHQIHHWYMKMKWNYTRDYIVPIWVFMPGKFWVSMGIKFVPAVPGCTAECFCPSAKGLNRQLRFLRKDAENVNQRVPLELVAVLTALTMHAASDRSQWPAAAAPALMQSRVGAILGVNGTWHWEPPSPQQPAPRSAICKLESWIWSFHVARRAGV